MAAFRLRLNKKSTRPDIKEILTKWFPIIKREFEDSEKEES